MDIKDAYGLIKASHEGSLQLPDNETFRTYGIGITATVNSGSTFTFSGPLGIGHTIVREQVGFEFPGLGFRSDNDVYLGQETEERSVEDRLLSDVGIRLMRIGQEYRNSSPPPKVVHLDQRLKDGEDDALLRLVDEDDSVNSPYGFVTVHQPRVVTDTLDIWKTMGTYVRVGDQHLPITPQANLSLESGQITVSDGHRTITLMEIVGKENLVPFCRKL